ncbi:hypothetical protein ROLI_029500 [Roseobacter fucihabitans]|uniref:Cation-transporting P-type ATPase C-terminal domain-containing protein n=1 Tax=Roseobacter fucihabitans TaxID=1537242 RepID=A0ABZ2BXG0_9RHOB|nr:hypothetical protein [Roseobacter litoralis]
MRLIPVDAGAVLNTMAHTVKLPSIGVPEKLSQLTVLVQVEIRMKQSRITLRQYLREEIRELLAVFFGWLLFLAMKFFPEIGPDLFQNPGIVDFAIFVLPILTIVEKCHKFRNRNADR